MVSSTIKNERLKLGLTQEKFAQVLGVTKQSVCDWEKGRHVPSYANLIKISKHFNIPTDNLLNFTMKTVEAPNLENLIPIQITGKEVCNASSN